VLTLYRSCLKLIWIAAQLSIWRAQEVFGPRFFLPSFLLPPKYNYQRALPARMRGEEEGEGGENVDAAGVIAEDEESGGGVVGDCVICMERVYTSAGAQHRHRERGAEEHESDAEQRYAIAPCEHLFHAACLEKWMERKMECPTCRRPLPDL
jgi:transmembrane E3 ubiquitin-protein ligase